VVVIKLSSEKPRGGDDIAGAGWDDDVQQEAITDEFNRYCGVHRWFGNGEHKVEAFTI